MAQETENLSETENIYPDAEIASKLSEDFDYVRVDLYEIEDSVLFGELTFAPNGYVPDYYEQWMLDELGEQLVLSK